MLKSTYLNGMDQFSGAPSHAHADAKAANSFHSSDTRAQFRAQQARIARLIGHAAYRRQAQIDRVRSVPFLFQVNPVSKHHGAIEGQAWLGAIDRKSTRLNYS